MYEHAHLWLSPCCWWRCVTQRRCGSIHSDVRSQLCLLVYTTNTALVHIFISYFCGMNTLLHQNDINRKLAILLLEVNLWADFGVWRPVLKSDYECNCQSKAWAPAEIFPEGGKITDTLKSRHVFGASYKKSTIFGAPKAQTKIFAFFRAF